MGTLITPGIPIRLNGTFGKSFEKRNPDELGANPGTLRCGTLSSHWIGLQHSMRSCFAEPSMPELG